MFLQRNELSNTIMHITNMHMQPHASTNEKHLQNYRQILHKSSVPIQFTVSRLAPGCKSGKRQFPVSVGSYSLRQLPIFRHWLYCPHYKFFYCNIWIFPCRIVQLNPRFYLALLSEKGTVTFTSSQFLPLCHPLISSVSHLEFQICCESEIVVFTT